MIFKGYLCIYTNHISGILKTQQHYDVFIMCKYQQHQHMLVKCPDAMYLHI